MPIMPWFERGRMVPTQEGMKVLKTWVDDTANPAEKGAKALHINSLHKPRGFGAKALGFFWLDVPFRAAGAAYRAAFQPGETCPLCVALRADGFTPRGNAPIAR